MLETFLRPLSWAEFRSAAAFRALRAPGTGEKMVLEENWFIETRLRATDPGITDDDLACLTGSVPRRCLPAPAVAVAPGGPAGW